jgi:SAM-dependent methyltransferase
MFDVPLPVGWRFEAGTVIAMEEHRLFTYAVAKGIPTEAERADTGNGSRLVRRFVFLKPSTYVVDDVLRNQDGSLSYRPVRSAAVQGPEPYRFVHSGDSGKTARTIHVFCTGGDKEARMESEAIEGDGRIDLTLTTAEHSFRLGLPPADLAAGEISVSGSKGERLLARRLLPSGILPAGPEGARLLERWDAAYRREGRPGWDTGRPSSNLKQVVEEGVAQPCRAVVLGCGTGTNAIFLAKQGFDVTGIDIAPTALSICRKKAEEAGVDIQWVLADVLALPDLEPFDFIFDRGCYHGVRRQNAAGYVESIRRISHLGTQVLILAGNANESRRYGPPRVSEEQLRGDFAESFEFRWLKQTNFDTREEGGKGALAWSALLTRKQN